MRKAAASPTDERRVLRRLIAGLLGAIVVLAAHVPAQAQFKNLASIDRKNRKLAGCMVDYTHNHRQDRRIYSPILGMPRDLYVYLPPGYSPGCAYPLILYLHLSYVDEHIFVGSDWIVQLDRMIQRGEFPPVVVACPDGTVRGENRTRSTHSFYINSYQGRFQDHLEQEVIPFLLSTYSIRPERQAHALIGISAGGFGAMNLALKRRDFFGAVATLASPLNLRYLNRDGRYRQNFNPATYRWQERYNPDEVVGRFYFGLSRVKASKYISPLFGIGPGTEDRIKTQNPADLLFSTDLQPGELAIYVNYPANDQWNFDAQDESFVWLASQKGVHVTTRRVPHARHGLHYFHSNHDPLYHWLSAHLLPPAPVATAR